MQFDVMGLSPSHRTRLQFMPSLPRRSSAGSIQGTQQRLRKATSNESTRKSIVSFVDLKFPTRQPIRWRVHHVLPPVADQSEQPEPVLAENVNTPRKQPLKRPPLVRRASVKPKLTNLSPRARQQRILQAALDSLENEPFEGWEYNYDRKQARV